MQRLMLVLACVVATAASATAAPYAVAIPAGWKDTTLASPDVDALKAKLETGGSTAEVQHHTAPDGTTVMTTFVEVYPHYTSRELLDAFERDARATTGKPISYRASDDATVRTIVEVTERDGKQVHVRRQVGFAHGFLRAASAECTGEAATCAPVLASLALDTTDFAKLAELRASAPPPRASSSGKMSPFELGMRLGFIIGIPLVGFFVYRRWRTNRS